MNVARTILETLIIILIILMMIATSIHLNPTVTEDLRIQIDSPLETYTFNSSMHFSRIITAPTYVVFNTTGFNITATQPVDVTIIDIDDDILNAVYDELVVEFNTNCTGFITISLSGLMPNVQYDVHKNNVSDSTPTANSTGCILFDPNSGYYNFKIYVIEDNTPPDVTINFVGNLSDSGGPYWRPPGEITALAGVWSDGYYTNDSRQSEGWIYINLTVSDGGGVVSNVWLQWLNETTWTNYTYAFTNTAGDYWEINTSDNFSTASGYDYSFNIVANDSIGNSNITWWNKTAMYGDIDANHITRRYVQLNCSTINISYSPFYVLEKNETHSDPDDDYKKDRLHHDQGTDGTSHDTGYLLNDTLNDDMNFIRCSLFTGNWFDESVCTESFTLDNIYYHVWWEDNDNHIRIRWKKYRQEATSDDNMLNDVDLYDTTAVSNITYDNGDATWSNDYHLNTGLIDVDDTDFTDNSIYELYVQFHSLTYHYPSTICNVSIQSFVLFNVPSNASLNTTGDTDGDGLDDWTELYVTFSNPFLVDTDDDGINDYWENQSGSDPNNWTEAFNTSNTAPTQTGVSPTNSSTGIGLTPSLYIICNDADSDTMNATWRSNSSGSWVDFATNTSISTGTNITQTNTNFSAYDTTYWWSVNLSDGNGGWDNETYYFTTVSALPSQNGEKPSNGSTSISRWTSCNVTCNDAEGDSLTVYFYENTTGSWVLQQTNSSHTANTSAVWSNYTNASVRDTKYWWRVSLTDGYGWNNETYHFTTAVDVNPVISNVFPSNGSVVSTNGSSVSADIVDSNGDTMNISIWSNHTGTWIRYAGYPLSEVYNIFMDDADDDDDWDTTDLTTYVSNAGWQDNGSYSFYLNQTVTEDWGMTTNHTTYYWSINATDSYGWTNHTYYFIAEYDPEETEVITNTATGVEEQNATLHGYLANDSGETCLVGFQYGETNSYGNITLTNYTLSLDSGWNTDLTFPVEIWNYNSSIASNDTCENFCQQGGIYDNIDWVFRENGALVSWGKSEPHNSLTHIDNYYDHPEYTYDFYTLNAINLSFVYDNLDVTKNSGETFDYNLTSLDQGQLYHYRAFATNSDGTVYGNDTAFLTKPLTSTSFSYLNTSNHSTLNMSWTKGTGGNNTYIERNGSVNWSRGEGTLVYNNTANYYNDTGLTANTTYYYQLWSYTNWTYNPTMHQWSDANTSATTSTSALIVDPPYNGSSSYDVGTLTVNLTWSRGNYSDREIVIQNNNTWATNHTDGWVRQNDTAMFFNESITYHTYFTVWSYNNTNKTYSTIGLNIGYGGLALQCFDEITHEALVFDILITNNDGTDTYAATNLTNIHYVDLGNIPYGDDTIFYVSNGTHESRTEYHNIYLTTFYNLTFYLPLAMPPGGTEDPDYDPENESYSTLYLVTVVDEANNGVEGAKIRIMRYINETGTYENVTILMSDANGQADVYLFAGTVYKVNLSKEGYLSRTDDWKPSDSIFTKTFKIIWEVIPFEPDTFGDIISFYGTLYVNNTMEVTFYDLNNNMIDSHFTIYENYNGTLTYMDEYNGTTSNDINFWINVDNATRLHIIVLYMNHSTLREVINYRIFVYPVHIDRVSGTWLENLIVSVVGDFAYGYVITFIWFFPCVILIGGLAAIKHPGIGILGAGLYSIWITWNITLPEEAKILTFASIAIVVGFITLFLVKGKKVIHK